MIHAMRDRQVWWNLVLTCLFGGALAWPLVLFDESIAAVVTGRERVNHLRVESIGFENGKFRQLVLPERGGLKLATWVASIYEGPEFICGSSGRGQYGQRLEPAVFSADEWTGDDCSEMIEGRAYQARATWGYWGSDNQYYEIHAQFDFVFNSERLTEEAQ